MGSYVIKLEKLGMDDVEIVGGKNASLGEMIGSLAASGVKVPGGFATTADAFREFLEHNALEERIAGALESLVGDEALRERLGRRARLDVEENYGLGSVVDRYTALYRELVSKESGA